MLHKQGSPQKQQRMFQKKMAAPGNVTWLYIIFIFTYNSLAPFARLHFTLFFFDYEIHFAQGLYAPSCPGRACHAVYGTAQHF
jgi:hypothetical protein